MLDRQSKFTFFLPTFSGIEQFASTAFYGRFVGSVSLPCVFLKVLGMPFAVRAHGFGNIEIVSTWWNLAKNEWPLEVNQAAIEGLKLSH